MNGGRDVGPERGGSDDDDLLVQLGSALAEADAVPPLVLRAAEHALMFRSLDAELAELVTDSLTSTVAVRSDRGSRVLAFESSGVSLDLDVTSRGTSRAIVGYLDGPHAALTLETTGGTSALTVDADGRFITEAESGPIRFWIEVSETTNPRRVVTSWIAI